MHQALITIITATFNSAKTVADTMRSVEKQDYPLIEHIVVDGLSTDDTLKIVQSFPHLSHFISEEDDGIYDAMNKGIRESTGDIIGILNSDDVYANSNVISRIAEAFSDSSVQACYSDLQYMDALEGARVKRTWKSKQHTFNSFHWGWMPPHPTFFVRKQVYDRVGLFETGLQTAADYEMMLRVLVKHRMKAVYVPGVMVKMRSGGISNASVKNRIRANREDREAWRMNDLKPYFFTLYLKPLRKIMQFLKK